MGAVRIRLSREIKLTPLAGIVKYLKGTKWNKETLGGIGEAGAAALAAPEPQFFPAGLPARAAVVSGPVAQPLPADLAAETLRRLDAWLGFSQTARRQWRERLPAVLAASLVLTGYAWSAGLKPVDVRIALVLGLSAAVLGRYTDSE